ncbi:MAG: hypothetical protein JNG86_06500 [Verrucomicrobiaceae bacterium]|nr:hypothetical protein [Verrucomicrobiaceae bacterium]
MQITFRDGEIEVLRQVLNQVVVLTRSGEVGILHGMERFVSTNVCLKKAQVEALQSAAKALGATIRNTTR